MAQEVPRLVNEGGANPPEVLFAQFPDAESGSQEHERGQQKSVEGGSVRGPRDRPPGSSGHAHALGGSQREGATLSYKEGLDTHPLQQSPPTPHCTSEKCFPPTLN